jgi:hypothetical protein
MCPLEEEGQMGISKRAAAAGSLAALALSGCYVVPIAPDGTPLYPALAVPAPFAYTPPAAPVHVAPAAVATPQPGGVAAIPGPPAPAVLQARLYPSNDAATKVGMLSGSVTNMMTGKGRFQLEYRGEVLVGEATRVPGDDRAGVANAFGDRGTFMNCTYRMTTPYQGTGTCELSTGARYQVHLGG